MAKTRARVQVTVDISVGGGHWGDDATAGQIKSQAIASAIQAMRRGLVIDGLAASPGVKPDTVGEVVGEPKVIAVISEL